MKAFISILLKSQYFSFNQLTITLAMLITSSSAFSDSETNRIAQYFNQIDTQSYRGNYSIIQQEGNNNNTKIFQSYSASYPNGNFSRIDQRGDGNTAHMTQTGGNNIGVILQQGNNHITDISQSGLGSEKQLEAYISQSGNRSDIHVSQSGSGYRSISVEQRAFSGNARPVTVETY